MGEREHEVVKVDEVLTTMVAVDIEGSSDFQHALQRIGYKYSHNFDNQPGVIWFHADVKTNLNNTPRLGIILTKDGFLYTENGNKNIKKEDKHRLVRIKLDKNEPKIEFFFEKVNNTSFQQRAYLVTTYEREGAGGLSPSR